MAEFVPRVTVWHHSAETLDAKTATLGTDLSIRTSHSCQILILSPKYLGSYTSTSPRMVLEHYMQNGIFSTNN